MTNINSKTRPPKTIEIIIQPVKNMERDFIAYYRSAMLSCTYSVYFKDTIMGALALNSFFDMLKSKYPGQIDFRVEDCELQFKNQALLDILSEKNQTEPV
jgi:hypothetical protein